MRLNLDNIRRVRDAIAAGDPTLFTMESFGDPGCGTPGCIAGWAAFLSGDWGDRETIAAQFLGIDDNWDYDFNVPPSEILFYGGHRPLESLTRADALHVLDWLLTRDRDPSSGEVEDAWDRAVAARLESPDA